MGVPLTYFYKGGSMSISDRVEQYIWKIGAKRAGAALAGWIVGKLLSASVLVFLASHGVTVDPIVIAASVEGGIVTGSVALHDWLKVRYGDKPLLKLVL